MRGAQTPLYAGFSILGAYHFPLNSGLALKGLDEVDKFNSDSDLEEDYQPFPFTATGGFSTLGVSNSGGDPITIFFVIPLVRLGSICKYNKLMFGYTYETNLPGSGMLRGSLSNQPSGFTASSSRISYGASSSQSAGFVISSATTFLTD